MHSEYIKGLLLTAVGVLVLSFDSLMIRLIGAQTFDLLFWRGLLLSLMVLLWCRFSIPNQPILSFDRALIRSALLFTASTITFVSAISMTSVTNVLVMISTQPLFAAILARFFLKESSSPITWAAIVISMIGILWVLSDSWHSPNLTGDLIGLVCSIALAGKFVNDRASGSRNMTPALILSGALTASISAVAGHPIEIIHNGWGWMLLHCAIIIPISFILITLGPRRIPAAEVGMLMLLETAIGPLWIWIWLNEIPSLRAVEGGTLVVGTLLLHGLIKWRSGQTQTATHH
ncbi:DMT family transporter [Halodesulfovibrio marinisediminis]|uniref:EamA domain-containing membrane protein RarD n=1 Tax=Halodesulfovibrio marinisediminis DSM 17456 TaxID=1121457 RepID=A0A1N6FC52_9BACT|nr:DMT family transporter [Halodesulfovibrio marinisediminis]SIN92830.1 EamA domain-containing membrane protein RarD [Halodesulfovibrio marinisediminis DSM 17456]